MDEDKLQRWLKIIAAFIILIAAIILVYFIISFIAGVPTEWEPRTPEVFGD